MTRTAFSLLEVIIATAVLAASAMVLSSLISLGSKYGNRAEERTLAISQAESLLDEFLAKLSVGSPAEESTGELPGSRLPGKLPKTFRITATPFSIGDSDSNRVGEISNQMGSGLLRVTVELFETSGANLSGEAQPLVQLTRLIRQPQQATDPTLPPIPPAAGTTSYKSEEVNRQTYQSHEHATRGAVD